MPHEPIPMIWRVETYRGETVAEFTDYYAAVDLVNTTTDRELYIAEPRYARPELDPANKEKWL